MSLGEIAYSAYMDKVSCTMQWGTLTRQAQEWWNAAAEAVAMAVIQKAFEKVKHEN